MKRILFTSGSLGLGHVGRDIEIAAALRKLRSDLEIYWMAESPASDVLKRNGEKVLPEADFLFSSNSVMDNSAKDYRANLVQWALNVRRGWAKNGEVYEKIFDSYDFDFWIGDEPYDVMIAMVNGKVVKRCPFVVIYDFLGLDASTRSPVDHIAAYMTNRLWLKFLKSDPPLADRSFFIGEPEDVPDRSFGPLLPNRRKIAGELLTFVGYIVPEEIETYKDKLEARRLLGYGAEPLIVCSIGGTSAGRALLDLCIKAYPIIKSKIPNVRMVLVYGPRLSTESVKAPRGVDVLGYVPSLYRHLGAADLCIVTGGGTITLELTALGRPFIYFPLEQHFEQEVSVAGRCARHGAGVKMVCSTTTPELLAESVCSNIAKEVVYAKIPIDGSNEIAKRIDELL